MKRKCDICGRLYRWTNDDPSEIHLKRIGPKYGNFIRYDVCPICLRKVSDYIAKLRKDSPRKCFWCEYDFGPKHPDYGKGCKECLNYSNFQLKKRMGPRQRAEWNLYFGEEE